MESKAGFFRGSFDQETTRHSQEIIWDDLLEGRIRRKQEKLQVFFWVVVAW